MRYEVTIQATLVTKHVVTADSEHEAYLQAHEDFDDLRDIDDNVTNRKTLSIQEITCNGSRLKSVGLAISAVLGSN